MKVKEFLKNIFQKENIGINILIISLSISGLICITTSAILNKVQNKKTIYKIKVVQKRVGKKNIIIPKLKDIEIEINNPLSVDVKDYIENINDFESDEISKFKLDTSGVNLTEAGKYTYTISYKKKKYNGKVTVKEKELPIINNMTLKSISIELGKPLPTNITDYIVETIPEEAKDKIVIDLSNVNTNMAGTYQYTVTYQDKIYTGEIKVYEERPQIINPTPKEEPKAEIKTEDTASSET